MRETCRMCIRQMYSWKMRITIAEIVGGLKNPNLRFGFFHFKRMVLVKG